METDCVYIGIGNSDDKLTQAQWSDFARETLNVCAGASKVVGIWFSEPSARYQNACICIRVSKPAKMKWLRQQLAVIAGDYGQDAISWAEAKTEMVGRDNGTEEV